MPHLGRLLLLALAATLVSGCACKRLLSKKANLEGRLRGVCTELEYAEDDYIATKLERRETRLRLSLAELYEKYCGRRCKEHAWVRDAPSCEEIGTAARERAQTQADEARAREASPAILGETAPAPPPEDTETKAKAAVKEMKEELEAPSPPESEEPTEETN